MATIQLNRAVDFESFNLNTIYNYFSTLYALSGTEAVHIRSEIDIAFQYQGAYLGFDEIRNLAASGTNTGYGVAMPDPNTLMSLIFFGDDITVSDNLMTGGTVTSLISTSTSYHGRMAIVGLNIASTVIRDAMLSETGADDLAIFTRAFRGNDRFYLSYDDDINHGYRGHDRLFGSGGNDTLYGDQGRDRLFGDLNDDHLFGGSQSDRLDGGSGNDVLNGGRGSDRLTGGNHQDIFDFDSIKDSSLRRSDLITDFTQGTDLIDLRTIDASRNQAGNNQFAFSAQTPADTSSGGTIWYEQIDNSGRRNDFTYVYLDVDSDRRAEGLIRLQGLIDLTADDFIL